MIKFHFRWGLGLGQLLGGVPHSEEGPAGHCHGLSQIQRLVCHWQLHPRCPLTPPQDGGLSLLLCSSSHLLLLYIAIYVHVRSTLFYEILNLLFH